MHRAALACLVLAACGGSSSPGATAPTATPAGASATDDGHHGHHAPHGDHDFSDAAAWAKVFDDPARDAWQKPDEVIGFLEPGSGHVVVDVGAGTGYFERYLSRAVGGAGKVYALDDEPAMIDHLRARAEREMWPNVIAQVVKPGDPALATASVDRVLVVDTWHHLPDRASYAAALATALRPGGVLAIVDFTPDATMGPPPAMRLSATAIAAELAAAGLTASIVDETLPHQYIVVGRKPTGRP